MDAHTDSSRRKVAVVLEELGLTYHPIYLDFGKNEQKAPEHVQYNPNGRIPTIIDHKNNDLVLWYALHVFLYSVSRPHELWIHQGVWCDTGVSRREV